MTDDAPQLPDQTLTLTEGARIPLLGFGTWQLKCDDAVGATSSALEHGYRHPTRPRSTTTKQESAGRSRG